MATTSTTTEKIYRAVIEHGDNAEFGRSMGKAHRTYGEAAEDAERLEALLVPADYTCPRSIHIEKSITTTTTVSEYI